MTAQNQKIFYRWFIVEGLTMVGMEGVGGNLFQSVPLPLFLFIGSFFMIMKVCNAWQMFMVTALFGAFASSFLIAQNALWPDYFGPLHIGNIRGFKVSGIQCLFSNEIIFAFH